MAAASVPTPSRLASWPAPRISGLIFLAMMGAGLTAPARGESVALSRRSLTLSDRHAPVETDELAGLTLPALGASPVTAATIHSAVASAGLLPAHAPPPPSGLASKAPQSPPPRLNATEPAALAVPEPATLVLGLTSTLLLGSLSWKRRLAHHHHPPRH